MKLYFFIASFFLLFLFVGCKQPITVLREKAFNGDNNAMLQVALFYKKNGDIRNAVTWFKASAINSNEDAYTELINLANNTNKYAIAALHDYYIALGSKEKAMDYYYQLALIDSEHAFTVAVLLLFGEKVDFYENGTKKAYECFQIAGKEGHQYAYLFLLNLIEDGVILFPSKNEFFKIKSIADKSSKEDVLLLAAHLKSFACPRLAPYKIKWQANADSFR